MSAAVEHAAASGTERRASSAHRSAVVGDLALAETARLAVHPAFLAGAALSIAELVALGAGPDYGYLGLMGLGSAGLGVGTLVAANLAATRSHRDGTDELYRSTPVSAEARTAAHLLAVGGAVVLAAAMAGSHLAGLHLVGDGVQIRWATGIGPHAPTVADLAQGPLAVALMGAVGVAAGRWIPSRALAAGAALLVVAASVPLVTWGDQGWGRWFFVFVNSSVTAGDGWWPNPRNDANRELVGFDTTAMAWHALYLAALAATAAAAALWRDARRPALLVVAASAALVAGLAGVAQLP